MVALVVTTDLVTVTAAESITGWEALGGGASGLAAETDYFIQGSFCVSKQITGAGTLKGQWFNNATGINVGNTNHVYVWMYVSTPGILDTLANGGMRIRIGSGTAALKEWYVNGVDTYARGGWVCIPVNLATTANVTTGTLNTGSVQYFGGQLLVTGTAKAANFGVDVIRYGGSITITDGDLATPGTFSTIFTADQQQTNRWGILQESEAGLVQAGRIFVGYASGTTTTRFEGNSRTIVFRDGFLSSTFNGITVRNAATTALFSNLNLRSLGAAKGDFIVDTTNPSVTVTNGLWDSMREVVLRSNTTVSGLTIRSSGTVTTNSAIMSNCTIASTTAAHAMLINSPTEMANVTDTEFSGNAAAIRITTAGTYTFDALQFSGNTVDVINASTGTVTINAINGSNVSTTSNPNGGTTVINNAKALTLNGLQSNSEVRIYRTSDDVELYGEENSGTSVTYSYNYTGDTPVYIHIHHVSYVFLRVELTLTSEGSTVPIQQRFDRTYSNP